MPDISTGHHTIQLQGKKMIESTPSNAGLPDALYVWANETGIGATEWRRRVAAITSAEASYAAAPAPAVVQAEVSELPPLPESSLWMTHESHYRLKDGGNCKGAVPVHGKPSSTAKLPLYTADQMRAYATAARGVL